MKILIISYYSKPLNGVSSYRIESFCKEFTKLGADVTLLTRHWNENFKSWGDLISSNKNDKYVSNKNGYREIRVPFHSSKVNRFSSVTTFLNYLSGNLHFEIDCYKNFKDEALELIRNEKDFNLVFVSSPPLSLVKLGCFLNKKTGVPFIVDFRDFFNNIHLLKSKSYSRKELILWKISNFYLKRWLKKALFISTVSKKLKTLFENKYQKPVLLSENGFEYEWFKNKEKLYSSNQTFTIRYIGSAYPHQDFISIIEGINLFCEKNRSKKIKVELIGLHNKNVEEYFKKQLKEAELLIIKERISKQNTVEKTINSDVLMLPWNDFDGVFGTKPFEYIASGSHVLLCPSDDDVIEKLIKDYENSSICSGSEDVYSTISREYDKWEKGINKLFSYEFKHFSREKIARKLYAEISKKINEKKN
ncbi:MAG: hypothetical protein WED10_08780 [Brumimicrobium sp.]